MTQSNFDKPLKTFFEPKTLRELDSTGHILIPSIRYEETKIPKQGLKKYLAYLPAISKQPISMDIDMGCVLLNQAGEVVDCVHYGQIRTEDASVRHGGDALVGAIEFEDKFINQEQISIYLDKLADDIHHIAIVISSYHKHSLHLSNKGVAELRDNDDILLHEIELPSLDKDTQAIIAWHLKKDNDDWVVHSPLTPIKHDDLAKILHSIKDVLNLTGPSGMN
ncbi:MULTISPECIES: TerD family protein [unclassified Moraxella]|uniref:TerD family protein n=1 Tax=unclassified Moraxella TaxID=2685852 RepID=UPI00359E1DD0